MRKLLSALLAIVLTLGFCVPAGASETSYSILRAGEWFGEGGYYTNGEDRKRGFIEDFAGLGATRPGTEYFLPLRAQDFEWERTGDHERPTALTPQIIQLMRFDLQLEYERGGEVFERIALVTRDGQLGLLIDFIDVYPKLEGTRFYVEAQFSSKGSLIEGSGFTISGELKNRNKMIYSSSASVPLGVGRMATGMNDCYGVKFDLGEGVTLTGDLLFADVVYGVASKVMTDDDKELQKKHPKISGVVRLETIGLSGRVRIDTGSLGVMNVYDDDLSYLGTTEGPLRFERVYYLAAGKL